MDRRSLLKGALAASAWVIPGRRQLLFARRLLVRKRPRPGDAAWPGASQWSRLNVQVGNRLIRPVSPLKQCAAVADQARCDAFFKTIANPYLIRDDPALTQSLGWVDAWTSEPSA